MNYHSDEWIMYGVKEHYNEALEYFPKDKIIGIFSNMTILLFQYHINQINSNLA